MVTPVFKACNGEFSQYRATLSGPYDSKRVNSGRREAALLTRPNMMKLIYFMLMPMAATGPASSQMKALTAEVFADNLTDLTMAASDQNAQSQNAGTTGKPDESLLILRTVVSEVHLV